MFWHASGASCREGYSVLFQFDRLSVDFTCRASNICRFAMLYYNDEILPLKVTKVTSRVSRRFRTKVVKKRPDQSVNQRNDGSNHCIISLVVKSCHLFAITLLSTTINTKSYQPCSKRYHQRSKMMTPYHL
jgi:hypothetical protein